MLPIRNVQRSTGIEGITFASKFISLVIRNVLTLKITDIMLQTSMADLCTFNIEGINLATEGITKVIRNVLTLKIPQPTLC